MLHNVSNFITLLVFYFLRSFNWTDTLHFQYFNLNICIPPAFRKMTPVRIHHGLFTKTIMAVETIKLILVKHSNYYFQNVNLIFMKTVTLADQNMK